MIQRESGSDVFGRHKLAGVDQKLYDGADGGQFVVNQALRNVYGQHRLEVVKQVSPLYDPKAEVRLQRGRIDQAGVVGQPERFSDQGRTQLGQCGASVTANLAVCVWLLVGIETKSWVS